MQKNISKKRKKFKAIGVAVIIVLLVLAIYMVYYIKQKNNNDNNITGADNNANIEHIDENNENNENNEETSNENIKVEDGVSLEKDTSDENSEDKKEFVYGEKVPENEAVTDEYFNDAVFIGNSQIQGISIYSSMKNTTVFAGKGIMVDTIFTKETVKANDGSRITIMDALAKEQFGKVYIMLGANELGWAYDYMFIDQYSKVIDEIIKLQPNAKVYVNAIMPVSKEKSDTDKIYNNKNINNYNKLILEMTKEKKVYYLDSKEALADAEGYLPEDAGTDGIHFNATYYEKWFTYLKCHTVV